MEMSHIPASISENPVPQRENSILKIFDSVDVKITPDYCS